MPEDVLEISRPLKFGGHAVKIYHQGEGVYFQGEQLCQNCFLPSFQQVNSTRFYLLQTHCEHKN